MQHWQHYRSQKLTGIICKVHRTWNTYNCLKASMKVVILQRSRVQVTVPKVFQSRNLGVRLLRAAPSRGGAGAAPSSANQTCKRCLTRSRLFIFTLLLRWLDTMKEAATIIISGKDLFWIIENKQWGQIVFTINYPQVIHKKSTIEKCKKGTFFKFSDRHLPYLVY